MFVSSLTLSAFSSTADSSCHPTNFAPARVSLSHSLSTRAHHPMPCRVSHFFSPCSTFIKLSRTMAPSFSCFSYPLSTVSQKLTPASVSNLRPFRAQGSASVLRHARYTAAHLLNSTTLEYRPKVESKQTPDKEQTAEISACGDNGYGCADARGGSPVAGSPGADK